MSSWHNLTNILAINFEISMNLSSLLLIITSIVLITYLIIRYKYLTSYSRTAQKDLGTTPTGVSVGSSTTPRATTKSNSTTGNYLDEFLSAIKVFGYLEKSVFHELTKNMTTQRVNSDEILYLDEKMGFSIVVDGTAQVYTKISHELSSQYEEHEEFFNFGNQRYQLLNEVKSGAPLSSLISTLDLFQARERQHFESVTPSIDNLQFSEPDTKVVEDPEYPDIICRPKYHQDQGKGQMTIAIIPYSAFQRVQQKYPKSTSHIVTMVLTRLYKVTMNTVHNYLGLTDELLKSEITLNNQLEQGNLIPQYLIDGLVEKLTNSPHTQPQQQQSQQSQHHQKHHFSSSSSRYVMLDSRLKSAHPGDLLSSVPISRQTDRKPITTQPSTTSIKLMSPGVQPQLGFKIPSFSDDVEETEETSLRIAIIENIFKIMGINDNQQQQSQPLQDPFSIRSSANSSHIALNQLYQSSSLLTDVSSRSSTPGRLFFNNNNSNNNHSLMPTINIHNLQQRESATPTATLIGSSTSKQQTPEISMDTIKESFASILEIKYLEPGTTLVEQDSFNSGLYYVINGQLEVYFQSPETANTNTPTSTTIPRKMYTVNPGGIAGYLTSVVGFRSLVSIKTPEDSGVIVGHIKKSDYSRLIDQYYWLQLPMAIKLKNLLTPRIHIIDYALEWCHIPAGNILCSQGDLANGFHVVLSGRFRVVRNENDTNVVLGEYGHGESIGEVEVLTASRRSNSLIAIRDSETARIPRTLFELLSFQNPSILVKVSRLVASKVVSQPNDHQVNSITSITSHYMDNDYKTITILPSVSGLPVREFADKLLAAFKTIGRNVIALDQASTLTHLGRHAFDERLARLKLSGYFAYLEEEYSTVVYICDTPVRSNWTNTCISQGDCILLLADADSEDVTVGEYEQLLIKMKTTARTDLCLIHQDKYVVPGSTSIWIKNRLWVQGHHHIQMNFQPATTSSENSMPRKSFINDWADRITKSNPNLKIKFEEVKNAVFNKRISNKSTNQQYKNDFLRLARILSNEAVGLVLGGGGSRGLSHVGVVAALERHGIPIDLIGGTSIGSFVGGLYARDYEFVSIYARTKQFSTRISALWRMILDFTYPVTSYITGYEFNRGIWKVFGFSEIEDFWIKFFCNSTNITNSTMDIHETGYSWRFIRASMSLAGLLPPIAFNGSMLLDGGYLDNLPVNEMKKKGAKYIIAVDVGSIDDRTPMNYGDTLSGFWVLFNRWNPFSSHPNVPNMMDIQQRLAYVASVNNLQIAKTTPGVIYLRPPIDDYATLDFGKFEEIYQVGLVYGDKLLGEWEKENKMPPIAGLVKKKVREKRVLYRRNSF
ncbi:Lysophospholipase NTE1 [Spathaspora sp. JA1]|nr:Lysophospholipase NTE1 [Spathaspora sp. JA1]